MEANGHTLDLSGLTLTGGDQSDMVNSPPHYNQSGIECIEAIYHALGEEGFISYCHGNAQKSLWRHAYKGNAIEDLKKAKWYINQIIETIGGQSDEV